jgi:hypothetical protein
VKGPIFRITRYYLRGDSIQSRRGQVGVVTAALFSEADATVVLRVSRSGVTNITVPVGLVINIAKLERFAMGHTRQGRPWE